MMDEWASSLYTSRLSRYITRSSVAKQCLSIYYSQYGDLNGSIINDRNDLLQKYVGFKAVYLNFEDEEGGFLKHHCGFLNHCLESLDSSMHQIIGAYSVLSSMHTHANSLYFLVLQLNSNFTPDLSQLNPNLSFDSQGDLSVPASCGGHQALNDGQSRSCGSRAQKLNRTVM